MEFDFIILTSCSSEDDTNDHQNENQNSNQHSEPGVNKKENEFETAQIFGGNTNKNDNKKKPNSQKSNSKNISKKVETLTSRVKSTTPADVINNSNDSKKGLLKIKLKYT